jgi:hypothetical protein
VSSDKAASKIADLITTNYHIVGPIKLDVKLWFKLVLLVLFVAGIVAVLLAVLAPLNLSSLQSTSGNVTDRTTNISYPYDFEPVIVGTKNGRVLRLGSGKAREVLLNAREGLEIDSLETDQGRLLVVAEKPGEESHTTQLFVMYGGSVSEIQTQSHVEDAEIIGDKIYVSAHTHGSESVKSGSVSVFELSGSKVNQIDFEAASKMEAIDGLLGVSGDDGDVMVLNASSGSVVSRFSHSFRIHDVLPRQDRLYIASTERRPSEIRGSLKYGSVSSTSLFGTEVESLNFDVTSLPHDIQLWQGKLLVLDSGGLLRKIDPSLNETGVSERLTGQPVDLVVSGDQAYVLDNRYDIITKVDVNDMASSGSVTASGVTAMAAPTHFR